MANPIVRNIDKKVVDALKTRADKHGPGVEAEHRWAGHETIRDTHLFKYNLYQDNNNGLTKPSQVMIDKITTIKTEKIGNPIGELC